MFTWNIGLTGRDTGRRKDPGWKRTMCWIPLSWPSFTRTSLTVPHLEAVADPVAVVWRQEGYCQRVTAVSTNGTHQIPITWFLIAATCQHSSTALLPFTHWMISNIPCWLTFCLLTSCSSVPIPVLHHSCAPPSPCSAVPFESHGKGKGHYHSDKPPEISPPAYLDILLISFPSAASR